ncbi:hypothetical protein A4H97_30455 [Niastella yeongjuensis]|uniref:DoxX family protein n=1 Tax=Niastella yeongjuensis TaxID=354355 RepID=A0A1V9EP48_9BACT|nr:hypothetical protein [Niastella yeongjuensis]OQP47929.1 hypothetical protein A4H97_30455 [Niastella yeongjuensis]SEP48031.1 hypothetical protein SAMN05660816_06689 [Niastella yeongjuensis]
MIPAYLQPASITTARLFYGLGTVGLGIQHFIYSAFRPVILPAWPQWMQTPVFAYLTGAAMIAAGVLILLDRNTKTISLLLGGFLLFCFLFIQLPFTLFIQPNSPAHLGLWTDPLKELALSGGAFVMAGIAGGTTGLATLAKLIPLGKYFFATTLLLFGIDHFLYTEFVASLVPAWVPDHTFWANLAGVALIGTGTAIFLKIKRRKIVLLASAMLFLWLILLHIPRAIADPNGAKGNEITSVFEALAFSGIALGIAVMKKQVMNNSMITITSSKAVVIN